MVHFFVFLYPVNPEKSFSFSRFSEQELFLKREVSWQLARFLSWMPLRWPFFCMAICGQPDNTNGWLIRSILLPYMVQVVFLLQLSLGPGANQLGANWCTFLQSSDVTISIARSETRTRSVLSTFIINRQYRQHVFPADRKGKSLPLPARVKMSGYHVIF